MKGDEPGCSSDDGEDDSEVDLEPKDTSRRPKRKVATKKTQRRKSAADEDYSEDSEIDHKSRQPKRKVATKKTQQRKSVADLDGNFTKKRKREQPRDEDDGDVEEETRQIKKKRTQPQVQHHNQHGPSNPIGQVGDQEIRSSKTPSVELVSSVAGETAAASEVNKGR
jgi:hypothetical protein